MTQYARPIADLATGAWTTAPLWSKLNEDPYDDGTEIRLNNQTANMCDIDLGTVTDPNSSVNHILRIRAHKTGTGSITCTAVLKCGTTTIRSNALTLGTSYAETTITLTGAEADAITDYTNLHVTLTGTCAATGRYIYVSWIVLDVPDAFTTVEETADAAKFDGISASDQLRIDDANIQAKFKGISLSDQVNAQDANTQAKFKGISLSDQVNVQDSNSQAKFDGILANDNVDILDATGNLAGQILIGMVETLIVEETLYGE